MPGEDPRPGAGRCAHGPGRRAPRSAAAPGRGRAGTGRSRRTTDAGSSSWPRMRGRAATSRAHCASPQPPRDQRPERAHPPREGRRGAGPHDAGIDDVRLNRPAVGGSPHERRHPVERRPHSVVAAGGHPVAPGGQFPDGHRHTKSADTTISCVLDQSGARWMIYLATTRPDGHGSNTGRSAKDSHGR